MSLKNQTTQTTQTIKVGDRVVLIAANEQLWPQDLIAIWTVKGLRGHSAHLEADNRKTSFPIEWLRIYKMTDAKTPKYKYNHPAHWLLETTNSDNIKDRFQAIVSKLDFDTIQNLFQDEMEEDGYFDDPDNDQA